jgi:hypothetical protein
LEPTPDPIGTLKKDINKKLDDIKKSEIDDPTTIINTSVSAITPQRGSTQGGTHVMIIGANFENVPPKLGAVPPKPGTPGRVLLEPGSVTIGGLKVENAIRVNDSTICGLTPAHPPTPTDAGGEGVDVAVTSRQGTANETGTKAGAFKYVSPPQGSSLSIDPPSDRIQGLSAVMIRASDTPPTDLTKADKVTIDGKEAQITSRGPSDIKVTVPPKSTQVPSIVDVVVSKTELDGASAKDSKIASGVFTYNDDKCPPQAVTKKKIIAYVDTILGRKIDAALFETRQLIIITELAMQKLPYSSDGWTALNQTLQATKALQDTLRSLALDPPIDAVGHQIQFIIAYNANVSPSWTLVSFKGPSPSSGSGFSATKTRTHTLNIAMGPPGSADAANTLGALQLGTAIGNSISVSGAAAPTSLSSP